MRGNTFLAGEFEGVWKASVTQNGFAGGVVSEI